MNKFVTVSVLIVVGLTVGVGAFVVTRGSANAAAQPITENTYFKDVQRLSEGTKPACLADSATANKAVIELKTDNYANSLDMVLGTRIIDMPAGMFDSTVNSFANNQARGTITFNDKNQRAFVGDLSTFNYVASVNPTNNYWKLDSLIACR